MKKLIVSLSVLALFFGFGGMARATQITFNFDPPALADNSNAATIGGYMGVLYGSPVTVTGHDGPVSETGLGSLLGGTNDGYVESESDSLFGGEHRIQINFGAAAPISSVVSFDYGAIANPFNAEYSLNGTTWINFFHHDTTGFLGLGSYTGSTSYPLPPSVQALRFLDGGYGEVGIDNLVVNNSTQENPIPEPATMLLLGSGLIGLVGFARRRFRK
jgi:hypothetical protein